MKTQNQLLPLAKTETYIARAAKFMLAGNRRKAAKWNNAFVRQANMNRKRFGLPGLPT